MNQSFFLFSVFCSFAWSACSPSLFFFLFLLLFLKTQDPNFLYFLTLFDSFGSHEIWVRFFYREYGSAKERVRFKSDRLKKLIIFFFRFLNISTINLVSFLLFFHLVIEFGHLVGLVDNFLLMGVLKKLKKDPKKENSPQVQMNGQIQSR